MQANSRHRGTKSGWAGYAAAAMLAAGILPAAGPTAVSAGEQAVRQFVYISVGGEKKIAVYSSDIETGKLTAAGSLQLEGAPGSLAVSPDGTRMYAAVRSAKAVATLKIDPTDGSLTQLAQTPVVDNPVYVLVDRTGEFLLTSYYGAGKAAIYRLGSDGVVQPEATQVVECEKNPHSIQASPSGQFVYVPNTGSDSILQYSFDLRNGRLQGLTPPKVTTAKGTGPRHVRFHPSAPYVYFVNEKGSSVDVFRQDGETGQLTAVQTIPTLPEDYDGKNYCADIELTPDGNYLYASNRGHDSLAGYRVNPETGKLTSLGQFPTEAFPREFAITPDGRFVYSAGQNSGKLALYRLDPESGGLNRFDTLDVGPSPAWVHVQRYGGKE